MTSVPIEMLGKALAESIERERKPCAHGFAKDGGIRSAYGLDHRKLQENTELPTLPTAPLNSGPWGGPGEARRANR